MKRDPNCTLCRLHATAEYVCLLGKGPKKCEVMIIGEAPGKHEDDSSVPFVGQAGHLLEEVMNGYGFNRDNTFITNAVSCRPPDNRTPSKAEIRACKKWLDYQIAMVRPRYVLLLGNVPLESITGSKGISKARGKPFEQGGIIYLPTFHPAFILRDPTKRSILETDFRTFRTIVDFGGIPEEKELNFTIVDRANKDDFLEDLKGCVSGDLETTCLYPWAEEAKVVSIGFGTAKTQWIIPAETADYWEDNELEDLVEQITEKLEDCFLVGHNWKFDSLWMRVRFGVKWVADFDTMIAHYMINENARHGLKELAMVYYGVPDWDIGNEDKTRWSLKTAKYHAHDLFYTRKLRYTLGDELHKDGDVEKVFKKIMMPCVELFTEAEFNGVYIIKEKMDSAERYLRKMRRIAKRQLDKIAKINWGSTKQVAEVLYDRLKIPCPEKTKKGGRSTSESALNQIDHQAVGTLKDFRAAKQQLSFFIEGWKPYLVNGCRLHPSFKLHGTVTGRLSCENPNLQQVPRDRRIRSLIHAPDGWELIEADLSQIELRIAAHLAGERSMIEAFLTGVDAHWKTAMREIENSGAQAELVIKTASTAVQRKVKYSEAIQILKDIGPEQAAEIDHEWKELRKKAKAVNFGYLFGMWWKKFKIYARDNYGVTVSDKEAKQSRVTFFQMYPGFEPWHKRQKRFARLNGYVRSLSGRKRRLEAATSGYDTPERREAERQAINSPVQSFANELNLMAAIQLYREFPRSVFKIVGTVHDAILMEVRKDWVERVSKRVLEVMSAPELLTEFEVELTVPIEAEVKIGPWGEGVSLSKWLDANSKVRNAHKRKSVKN